MGGFGEDHEVHRLDGNVLDLDATFLLGEVRERKGELDHEHHGKNRSAHDVPQARFLYRFQKVNLSTYVEGNRKIRSCENLDTATLSLQLKLSGPGHRAVRSLLFNATQRWMTEHTDAIAGRRMATSGHVALSGLLTDKQTDGYQQK